MTIVSNLKYESQEHLAKIRLMKYYIEYGKEFLANNRADLEFFTHVTRNINPHLSF